MNATKNDLDWLAFCYVHDELEREARSAFEVRLDNDQLAREAVAQAVALAAALPHSDAVPERPEHTSSHTAGRWALVAACGALAASVAAVIALRAPEARVPTRGSSVAGSTADAEVALAWDELQRGETMSGESFDAEAAFEAAPEGLETDATVDGTEDLVAPEWLMDAVQVEPAVLES